MTPDFGGRMRLGWGGILMLLAGCGETFAPPQLVLAASPPQVKTDEKVTVSWNALAEAGVFRVAVDTDGDGTLEPVEDVGFTQVSFSQPGTITLRGEAEDYNGVVTQTQVQVEVQSRQGELAVVVK